MKSHWCTSVLNKRFLTPFRDGIWNRRQVSVGDRGVLPTRPRNRRGYALLAHTFGKMRSCATGERSNTEIRTVELKNTIIRRNYFRSQVHPTQSVPAKRFRSYVHPTQSLQGKRFRSQVHHTQFFPLNRLRYWMYHTRSVEETVWQRLSITHSFYVVNVCARWPNANSFQEKVVCDCSLIQHGLFLETVCVAWGHRPRYFFNNRLQ